MSSTIEPLHTDHRQTTLYRWRTGLLALLLVIVLGGGFWWANRSGLLVGIGIGSSSSEITASSTTNPTGTNAGQLPLNPGQGQFTGSQDAANATGSDSAALSAPPANPDQSATDASAAIAASAPVAQPSSATDVAPTTGQVATSSATNGGTQHIASSVVAVVGAKGTLVWQADGSLLTTLEAGTKVNATEQTTDGTWLQVTNGSAAGWVEATTLIIFDQNQLAVVPLPEAITSATTQTAPLAAPSEEVAPSEEAVPALNEFKAQNLMTDSAPATESTEVAVAAITPTVTATVVTTGARLNIRTGPDTAYAIATKATNGTTLTVLGRDESGTWLEVQLPDDSTATGWIAANYVQLAVPITEVPTSTDAI